MSQEFMAFSKWVTRVAYVFLVVWLFVCAPMMSILVPHMDNYAKPRSTSLQFRESLSDGHGQGIVGYILYENSTVPGSWNPLGGWHGAENNDTGIEWNASLFIRVAIYTYFNSTLTGASSTAEGQLYQKHGVTVTSDVDGVVYSKQNFTYQAVNTAMNPIWEYVYLQVLNFEPQPSRMYTLHFNYSTYYVTDNPLGDPIYSLLAKWDFANVTSWVDHYSYIYQVGDGKAYIDDDNAGMDNGYAYYSINLDLIDKLVVKIDYIRASTTARVHFGCDNATLTFVGWTTTGTKTVDYFSDSFNVSLIAIGWGDELKYGYNMVTFDYLYLYHLEGYGNWNLAPEDDYVVMTPLHQGMLLAGVMLIGLCLIPIGTTVGAVMIKSKKMNEDNWLLPFLIVFVGFAVFIGTMTTLISLG